MRHRLAVALAAALLVMGVVAAPASAAKPGTESFGFSEAGLSAFADTFDCVENSDGTQTCSGTNISAFSGKRHAARQGATQATEVCYSSFTDTFDPETGVGSFAFEFGCEETPVVFDQLSSATIPSSSITVEGESCVVVDPDAEPEPEIECTPTAPREVVVEGTFTGEGPVTRSSFRSFQDDGICVVRESSSGSSRQASFDGTIDGEPFDPQFASINDGKFSFSGTCSLQEE